MLPPENNRIYWLAEWIGKTVWWPYCSLSKKSGAAKSWQKPTILLHLAWLSFTLIFIGQVRFYTVQYIH